MATKHNRDGSREDGSNGIDISACDDEPKVLEFPIVTMADLGTHVILRPENKASIKPIERLVPVSFTHHRASTPGLSTWWSTTALREN